MNFENMFPKFSNVYLHFRWAFLQEILNNWQSYRSEEKRLSEWLAEKESNLKDVSQVDLGDKMALALQLQQLKVEVLCHPLLY